MAMLEQRERWVIISEPSNGRRLTALLLIVALLLFLCFDAVWRRPAIGYDHVNVEPDWGHESLPASHVNGLQSRQHGSTVGKPSICPVEELLDVAVVGGGISGLYAAWRLQKHSASLRIAVFEASHRFGGRLYSVNLPGMPNVTADLGAMHFLDDPTSVQSWLFKSLGLQGVIFPMNSSDPRLPFVLRGRRFTAAELADVSKVTEVYDLSEAERSFYSGPGSLYSHYTKKMVPNYDSPDLDPWTARTSDGRLLKDLGWLELVKLANMSDEAMRLIIDSSGFADFWDNPNAASLAVQHDAFLNASVYKTFPFGMAEIASRLVDELKTAGTSLHTNMYISQLQQSSSKLEGSYFTLRSNLAEVACARKVILALPPNALSELEWPALQHNTAWKSVRPVHAMKLYLGFDQPWWREPPTQSKAGWLYTSLPIQQVLYLGSQEDFSASSPALQNLVGVNRNSLLMAMYCTEQYTALWESFSRANASMKPFEGHPNPFATGKPVPQGVGRPVTVDMIRKVLEDIAALHNIDVESIPPPYTAVLSDWDSAWHWWKPGSNASALGDIISQLDHSQDVYICGEAFSILQGWLEGALRSTERVLQLRLGLPPLSNMPLEYHPSPVLASWNHIRYGRFAQSNRQ